jgi:hypothetical protein
VYLNAIRRAVRERWPKPSFVEGQWGRFGVRIRENGPGVVSCFCYRGGVDVGWVDLDVWDGVTMVETGLRMRRRSKRCGDEFAFMVSHGVAPVDVVDVVVMQVAFVERRSGRRR